MRPKRKVVKRKKVVQASLLNTLPEFRAEMTRVEETVVDPYL